MNNKEYQIIKDYFWYDSLIKIEKVKVDNIDYYKSLKLPNNFKQLNNNQIKSLYVKLINDNIKVDSIGFTICIGEIIIEDLFPYFFDDFKYKFLYNYRNGLGNRSINVFIDVLEKFTKIGPRNTIFKKVITNNKIIQNALKKELNNFKGEIYNALEKRLKEMQNE